MIGQRLAILAVVAALAPVPGASAAANPIQVENAKPGTTSWDLPGGTSTRIPTPSSSITGYASEISVAPGETLHLHVGTTPAADYRIEIYRLGWYQGAGGRLVTCIPACPGSEPGVARPMPTPDPTTGYLDAGWPVTDTVTVGSAWTSGYYVAKLILVTGPNRGQASWVPFIVRAPAGTHSTILVQAPVNTWEAYNNWGGKSLYTFNSTASQVPASGTPAAAMVSFNRPFSTDLNAGPFSWEYQLVRYLEREGYDVSYQADVDTDEAPASLLGHRLAVVSGHDEYWSQAIRDAFEAARSAAVNLAFMGGNIGYWQLRYANSDRTLIEYRSAPLDPNPNPAQKTIRFSALSPPRPECELLGVGYPGGLANALDPPRSYSVTPASISNSWFAGTGFSAGDTIFGSVGYEWDNVQPGCAVPPLHVLLHFSGLVGAMGSSASADAVTYTASSGARVISSGSLQLSWALDDFGHSPHADARVQRLFTNVFNDLGAPPGSQPPVDNTPPAPFALRAPRPGALLWTPSPHLSWSPSRSSGSGIGHYVIVVDHKPVGTSTATTYTFPRPLADGRHTWMIVAVDRAGHRRASATRVMFVSSVRIVPRSHATVISQGLRLQIYCEHRCSLRVRVGLTRTRLIEAGRGAARRAVITTIAVALPASVRQRLTTGQRARVYVAVTTLQSGSRRTVWLVLRW